jgi:hypothetical protein
MVDRKRFDRIVSRTARTLSRELERMCADLHKDDAPSSAFVGLKVRLREPLRKKLEVAAKKRGVSLNAELVARLEESFRREAAVELGAIFTDFKEEIAKTMRELEAKRIRESGKNER